MTEEVYKELCNTMAKRGGRYPALDIPEFYKMARELFTPEEAAVCNAMPRGFNPASAIAKEMGKSEEEVSRILEGMADKGLCTAGDMGGTMFYGLPPFVPGIFEFQFMRGTKTDKDKKLAKLIHAYKEAYYNTIGGPPKEPFPLSRVITVDRTVKAGNIVHTYNQMASYIDKYDPISVSTCFCRHEAELIDEHDQCEMPNSVCMQFGMGAQYLIDRGMAKKVTKEEAMDVLKESEEAGLVHCSNNQQEIDFVCNCCSCHCMILKSILAQSKPGLAMASGFQPVWDPELCTACEICIDRCPMTALTMGEDDIPEVDLNRCIGCGVCSTGCPEEAIAMEERPEVPVPPMDRKALSQAVKESQA